MENISFIPVEEVKTKGQFLKAICFKPKTAPIICMIMGIGLIAVRNIYTIILGVFFILMSLLVLIFVKDFKTVDIFDKGVMIYGDRENKTACFIDYDDIVMWAIRHENGHDTIEFNLGNGQQFVKDSFEVDKAYKTLNSLIKEKEYRYLEMQKNRKVNLSIPDAINNIRKKYFKKND